MGRIMENGFIGWVLVIIIIMMGLNTMGISFNADTLISSSNTVKQSKQTTSCFDAASNPTKAAPARCKSVQIGKYKIGP